MRLLNISFLAITALLISACGKTGGTLNLTLDPVKATGNPDTTNIKPLFSQWTEANNYYQIDLRPAQFGVYTSVVITTLTGQNCSCKVLVQGSESSGTMAFSTCAGTYPDCGSFNLSGNYTKSNTSLLQFCVGAAGCTNLK